MLDPNQAFGGRIVETAALDSDAMARVKKAKAASKPGATPVRMTAWSKPSRTVTVPLAGSVHIAGAKPATDQFNSEPKTTLLVQSFGSDEKRNAIQAAKEKDFQRGNVANMTADTEVLVDQGRAIDPYKAFVFQTDITVADIRGTSPKVWNAWKGKLLEDLYRLALRALGGATPNMEAEIEARKLEARQMLALRSALPETEKPLWDTLDVGYFARHDASEIAWHARSLWRHVKTSEPVVSARPSPVGEGLQVLVYSPDRADLFARICGYFDSAGFSIQDAKIHTSRAGYALDTFQIVHPGYDNDDHAGHRDLISLIETSLVHTLAEEAPLPTPRTGRVSRRVRSFPVTPRVSLRPDERAQRWILEVSASDRTGLLYGIARVLARHHVNLQLAKISTLGERVEDTFLVDGPELQHNRAQLQIESELLDAITPP